MVLLFIAFICMCGPKGYGFVTVLVRNRVLIFGPSYCSSSRWDGSAIDRHD